MGKNKRTHQPGASTKVPGNSLKDLAREARAEENGGTLPTPKLTVAAPGTGRRAKNAKRRTQAGHGR